MPISLGTTTVTAIYLGTTSITSAYLGNTQVFGGASAPDLTLLPIYGQSLSLGVDPDGSVLVSVEASKTITAATAANPVVITAAGHGYANGDTVFISGVGGMTQLNGLSYQTKSVTTDTFELYTHDGKETSTSALDGTLFSAFTSGGTVAKASRSATHKMFSGGVRPHYDYPPTTNVNTSVFGVPLGSIVSLEERIRRSDSDYGETMAFGMGLKITRPTLMGSMGRAAYRADQLLRNTTDGFLHYTNLVAIAQRTKELSGGTLGLGPLVWKQGEADGGASTAKSTWKTRVQAVRADSQRSFRTALRDSSLTLPLVLDQQAYQQAAAGYANIAVAAVELHREDANIYCVGPAYWHDLYTANNDVHPTAAGYKLTGEFFGRAIDAIMSGNGWQPCHISGAPTRSGTTISVPVHVPFPPLTKDTSLVAAVSNDGFTYSGATITAVTVTDNGATDNQGVISITINASAGGTLGYAYNNGTDLRIGATLGPRGNIRDSSSETASTGQSLYNWLCVDQWSVS